MILFFNHHFPPWKKKSSVSSVCLACTTSQCCGLTSSPGKGAASPNRVGATSTRGGGSLFLNQHSVLAVDLQFIPLYFPPGLLDSFYYYLKQNKTLGGLRKCTGNLPCSPSMPSLVPMPPWERCLKIFYLKSPTPALGIHFCPAILWG